MNSTSIGSEKSMPFVYSPDVLSNLEQTVSIERLASYSALTGGDKAEAILLHERNTIISEGLYGILQVLEVSIRNSIHRVLTTDMGRSDWYDHVLLKRTEKESIQEAKDSICRRTKISTPGRIVAELTFGFWVRLISPKYEKLLWVKHIYKSFPNLHKPNRILVFDRVDKIRNLRNRIAHHERVVNRNINQDYQEILETLNWVCPVTATWVNAHNSLQKIRNNGRKATYST